MLTPFHYLDGRMIVCDFNLAMRRPNKQGWNMLKRLGELMTWADIAIQHGSTSRD